MPPRTSRPPRQRPLSVPNESLGVGAGAEPVHHDDGLVPDHPGVVPARQGSDIAGSGDEFRAVVHPDGQPPTHVVLEMGCLTTLCFGDRLYVIGPPPPRPEDETADL